MSKTVEDKIMEFIIANYTAEIDEDFLTYEGAIDAAIRLLTDRKAIESNGVLDMVAKLSVRITKLEKELASVRAHAQTNTVSISALDEAIDNVKGGGK